MISQTDYLAHDAVALAGMVRAREVSASELLEAAILRAEAVNPALNAIVITMYERARERAAAPLTGALAGVPFLIKDLFQDFAGVPSSSGCAAWKRANVIPARHSEIVARWLSAGAVIFGRTNTPEFGAKGITEPEAWGPTRNPWRLSHSPGGSSGGSAAAVAAGVVPIAGASDGGGSIRIPAASTGLFGLKPGRGRTPTGPDLGEVMHGAAVNHVLSRSVRDSALLLDLTHGHERVAPFRIAPPERSYSAELEREPGRLRVAFSTRSPIGTEVHADAIAAVTRTARLLEGLGHVVVEAEPAIDGVALARDFCVIWFANLAAQLQYTRDTWGASERDFELDSLAIEAIARSTSSTRYAESYTRWCLYGAQLSAFLANHDLFMTPTLALPPPRIGQVKTPRWAEGLMRTGFPLGLSRLIPLAASIIEQVTLDNLKGVPFTQLANVTGVPAMSVPLGAFSDGLPLGVHFLADHGGEGVLLALAAQLERAAPWAARRPSL